VSEDIDHARAIVARRLMNEAGADKARVCLEVSKALGKSVAYCEDAFWGSSRPPAFWRTLICGVLGFGYNAFETAAERELQLRSARR
jgi:hypothetical protein